MSGELSRTFTRVSIEHKFGGPVWSTKTIRDMLTFLLGMGGFIHEIIGTGERPFVLTACLALMGLPLLLRADEK